MLLNDADAIVDVYNNIVYGADEGIKNLVALNPGAQINIFNNTVLRSLDKGIASLGATNAQITLRNNISHSNVTSDFQVPAENAASNHNLASDGTGTTHSPGRNGLNSVP